MGESVEKKRCACFPLLSSLPLSSVLARSIHSSISRLAGSPHGFPCSQSDRRYNNAHTDQAHNMGRGAYPARRLRTNLTHSNAHCTQKLPSDCRRRPSQQKSRDNPFLLSPGFIGTEISPDMRLCVGSFRCGWLGSVSPPPWHVTFLVG